MSRRPDDDGLKRVSQADRKRIALSSTLNRFWRHREDNRSLARIGPGRCRHCGGEPCAASWGPLLGEESARCCDRCSHEPVKGWRPSHIFWLSKKAFFVLEVLLGKAGSVYLRQDGVAWFIRVGVDHFFLGRKLGTAEFARFKVSDRNGWPEGLKGEDMGVGIDDSAFETGDDLEAYEEAEEEADDDEAEGEEADDEEADDEEADADEADDDDEEADDGEDEEDE